MNIDKKQYYLVLIIVLFVILILNILLLFKKDTSWKLETIKVGGAENMELIQQLYSSESYIAQQTTAIEQALTQMNGANNLNIQAESDLPSGGNNNEILIENQNLVEN